MFARAFKRYIGFNGVPAVEASYTHNDNDSLFKKIKVIRTAVHYDHWGWKTDDVLYIDCADTKNGRALANIIFLKATVVKVWEGKSDQQDALRWHAHNQLYTKYAKVEEFRRLAAVLHNTLNNGTPLIDEETLNQLLADMDIKVRQDDVHADILAQADISPEKGKELAKQYYEHGYHEIFWLLAEHFRQKDLLHDAAEMYIAIQKGLSHFAEASSHLGNYILSQANIDVEKGKKLSHQYYEHGHTEALWLLAEHFKQNNLLNDAAEMYTAIPSDNGHYAESRLQLRSLFQGQLTANELGKISLTPEQIQFIREKLLELSLLAGDHEFSTSMFYDLSGFGLLQHTHQIKLNSTPETFIHLTRQIAELNKEKQKLHDELVQLKQGSENVSGEVRKRMRTSHSSANQQTGDTSATSSRASGSSFHLQSSASPAAAIPMSFYSTSSPAMYRQPSSAGLDSDDDVTPQSLSNFSIRKVHS